MMGPFSLRIASHRDAVERDDRGSVVLWTAIVMMAMVVSLGLVVDGGGKLQAKQRAEVVANEAARRAGQAIVLPLAVRAEGAVVEPMAALIAANRYLAAAGPDVRGTAIVTSPTTLRVTVEVDYEPRILTIVGMGTMRGGGAATVHLNHTNTGGTEGLPLDLPKLPSLGG